MNIFDFLNSTNNVEQIEVDWFVILEIVFHNLPITCPQSVPDTNLTQYIVQNCELAPLSQRMAIKALLASSAFGSTFLDVAYNKLPWDVGQK